MQNQSAVYTVDSCSSRCSSAVNMAFGSHYYGIVDGLQSDCCGQKIETEQKYTECSCVSGWDEFASATCSNSVEALLKWSVTRSVLRACSDISVVIFTVSERIVHLALAQVEDDSLVTKQWFLSPDMPLLQVVGLLKSEQKIGNRCYIFTPGRRETSSWEKGHLGTKLTRTSLLLCCPDAAVVHMDSIARLAKNIQPRFIGADAKHWLTLISRYENAQADVPYIGNEYLTAAVKADCALILRLLVTPSGALMHV